MKGFLVILTLVITTNSFGFIVKKDSKIKSGSKRNISYDIAFKNFAMPFPLLIKSEGVEVGFNIPIKKSIKKQRLNIGANAGFFTQKNLQNNFYLQPKIEYKQPVYKGVSISANFGAGAQFVSNSNKEFGFKGRNSLEKLLNIQTQFLGAIGIAPEIKLGNDKHFEYAAFVSYQFGTQIANTTGGSLLPMSLTGIGIRVIPKIKK